MSIVNNSNRGLFIVIEGLDRSGKTTQSKLLQRVLDNTEWMCFPDTVKTTNYTTEYITKARLNNYKVDDPELFNQIMTVNREICVLEYIIPELLKGTNIVCDRYLHSGISYSLVRDKKLDLKQAILYEADLIYPDIVIFLDTPIDSIVQRDNFGNDFFDTVEQQTKVRDNYLLLKSDNWIILDTSNKSVNDIHDMIVNSITSYLSTKRIQHEFTIYREVMNLN